MQVRFGQVTPQVQPGRWRHSSDECREIVDEGGDPGEGDGDIELDRDPEGVHGRGVAVAVSPQPTTVRGCRGDGDVQYTRGGLDRGGELVGRIGAPHTFHQQVGSVVSRGGPAGKRCRQTLVVADQRDAAVEHQLDGVQGSDRGPKLGDEIDGGGEVRHGDQRGRPRAGQPDQAQLHPGDDSQGAFAADEQRRQVVADVVLG